MTKTARPTFLLSVWCGASEVASGLPVNQCRQLRSGPASGPRMIVVLITCVEPLRNRDRSNWTRPRPRIRKPALASDGVGGLRRRRDATVHLARQTRQEDK